jgi:pyrimidine oxygenase
MQIGVFIPIGNNGWLISENSPQYRPTFALNKQTTLTAEKYGLDFVLSMIKLRGFGGKTEFWDHNLESFTLMAGLAAVTTRIKLFATCWQSRRRSRRAWRRRSIQSRTGGSA